MRKEIVLSEHRFELRSWTYGMKQRALRAATSWSEVNNELQPDVDPYVLNDNMLVECVEGWDLLDESGNPLAVTIENIHEIEPPELVEQLIAEVQRMNGVTLEERKKS